MHSDRLGELTDDLIQELRIGGQFAIERLYELREPIRYIEEHPATSLSLLSIETAHRITHVIHESPDRQWLYQKCHQSGIRHQAWPRHEKGAHSYSSL